MVRVARAREPPALPVSPQRRLHTITTPYESDYKIAELVGLFLVHEPDTANRRRIWEPWFALQGPCHHWVDLLLSYAYLAAANVDERTSQFPALMHDMFEHALAEGGWLDGQSRSSGGRFEVGRAFLGFGSLAHGEFWAAERAPTAISLRAYWPRWVDVAMTWLWCARAFTRMLRKPAFAPLRPSCLHWLVRVPPARWMTEDDDEAPVALVRLLELVWQERSEEGHELAGPLRDVFEQLLRELVARHEPDAVQLSARVGRNK